MAFPAAQLESTSHSRILGIKEVMLRLGIGRSSVYRLGDAGTLNQATSLDGCRTAGWFEDEVDALVESRPPAGKKPVMPAVPTPAKSARAGMSSGISAGQTGGPVRRPAESALATIGKQVPDLVPTTMRMMGNVVYLHAPTGRLLMDVGSLSSACPGLKLDSCAITAIEDEVKGAAGTPG